MDRYILLNRANIEFNKNIKFTIHPELADNQEALRNTLSTSDSILFKHGTALFVPEDDNTNYSYGNTHVKKFKNYTMKTGYLNYEYIIEKIKGAEYILARAKNSNTDFTVEDGKKIAWDYFKPI